MRVYIGDGASIEVSTMLVLGKDTPVKRNFVDAIVDGAKAGYAVYTSSHYPVQQIPYLTDIVTWNQLRYRWAVPICQQHDYNGVAPALDEVFADYLKQVENVGNVLILCMENDPGEAVKAMFNRVWSVGEP